MKLARPTRHHNSSDELPGCAAGVLLSPAEFGALTERIRFVNAVAQGLEDARSGKFVTHESMVAEVQTRYGDQE